MTQAIAALTERFRHVRSDWQQGRRDGFPLCCIAMFCWDSLWGLRPAATRIVAQGVTPADSPHEWVPCGLWHHHGSSLTARRRFARIARFWIVALGPASGVWRQPVPGAGPPFAPWRSFPAAPRWSPRRATGPTEAAWADLDAMTSDADLDWE